MNRTLRMSLAPAALPLLLVLLVAGSASRSGASPVPDGWINAGSAPQDFDIGVDRQAIHGGKACGFLKSRVVKPSGFGTLMQMCKPDAYRGRRVRMSAWVKAEGVTGWAGVWMRVDGAGDKVLSFDNMQSRPIKGTRPWTRAQVVLDVAPEATALAFGILLNGPGKVWIDDLQFEVVDRSVATTGIAIGPTLAGGPQNLDFEK